MPTSTETSDRPLAAISHAAVALPDPRRIAPDGAWERGAYDTAFAALHAAGYHRFELSHARRLGLSAAAAIRERTEAMGLRAVTLHAPALHGPDALPRLLEIVPVARALGAALLVFHVSSLRFAAADRAVRERARAWDRERVRALAERAGEAGMEVALENASHPKHPDYLLELCETLTLPNLGVALDTGHANLRGTAAHEVAALLAPAVRHTHLHDNRGLRDEHLPPGHGTIHWPALAATLRAAGYTGAWCVELKRPRFGDYTTALREAKQYLERLKL